MQVDWSTAEVVAARDGDEMTLKARLVDVRGNAYHDAFEYEVNHSRAALGAERRDVQRTSTGMSWGIEVSPIDPNDVEGEKRLLDEFVERVNRRAAPEQAKLDEQHRRQQEEREARDARARTLTDRLRDT
jgi:hypothetical protein